MPAKGLTANRRPATLEEALAMVAYNERVIATSRSAQRIARARAMLRNLQLELHALRQRVARPPARTPRLARTVTIQGTQYEVTFDGSVR